MARRCRAHRSFGTDIIIYAKSSSRFEQKLNVIDFLTGFLCQYLCANINRIVHKVYCKSNSCADDDIPTFAFIINP